MIPSSSLMKRTSVRPHFTLGRSSFSPKEQPLSAAFRKIYQAVGLFDYWLDISMALPTELEPMSQHAVQAIVWREAGTLAVFYSLNIFQAFILGCEKLAHIEEDVYLFLTETGSDNSTRLTVVLNRAYSVRSRDCFQLHNLIFFSISDGEEWFI